MANPQQWLSKVSLKSRIVIGLIVVIVPTTILVTLVQNKLVRPLLESEIRQVGVSTAKALSAEILKIRPINTQKAEQEIQARIEEILYSLPQVTRIDVAVKDANAVGQPLKQIASTDNDDWVSKNPNIEALLGDRIQALFKESEQQDSQWDIVLPLVKRDKVFGYIHLELSNRIASFFADTLWRSNFLAGGINVFLLVLMLSLFLRKLLENERLLRLAESENLSLTKQLHEQERQLLTSEKFSAMGQLTATFAHEIGTPLNALSGHVEILSESLPAEQKQRVSIIKSQVDKIALIVRGFLQTTSQPVLKKEKVSINDVLIKSAQIVEPRLQSVGIGIEYLFGESIPDVRIPRIELEQITLNLLNNAIDSPNQKRSQQILNNSRSALKITLKSGSIQSGQRVFFEIQDTGEGIPNADLLKVFDPFFTTKAPGSGTGLGLTVCDAIVRRNQGTISVESKQGEWTRFRVELGGDDAQ